MNLRLINTVDKLFLTYVCLFFYFSTSLSSQKIDLRKPILTYHCMTRLLALLHSVDYTTRMHPLLKPLLLLLLLLLVSLIVHSTQLT